MYRANAGQFERVKGAVNPLNQFAQRCAGMKNAATNQRPPQGFDRMKQG
jgi:hypothetical protein